MGGSSSKKDQRSPEPHHTRAKADHRSSSAFPIPSDEGHVQQPKAAKNVARVGRSSVQESSIRGFRSQSSEQGPRDPPGVSSDPEPISSVRQNPNFLYPILPPPEKTGPSPVGAGKGTSEPCPKGGDPKWEAELQSKEAALAGMQWTWRSLPKHSEMNKSCEANGDPDAPASLAMPEKESSIRGFRSFRSQSSEQGPRDPPGVSSDPAPISSVRQKPNFSYPPPPPLKTGPSPVGAGQGTSEPYPKGGDPKWEAELRSKEAALADVSWTWRSLPKYSEMNKSCEANSDPDAPASLAMPEKGPRRQHQRQNHGREEVPNRRMTKCITHVQLAVLSGKSDREILFRMQNHNTGFVSLLQTTDYPDQTLDLVMDILAKVCRNDDCPHTASALLQTALYTKLFRERMVAYLQTAKNPVLLRNLLVVFCTVLREFRTEAVGKLGRCLALGSQAVAQLILPSGYLADGLTGELRRLTEVQRQIKEGKKISMIEFPATFHVSYQPPPDGGPQTSREYKLRLFHLLQKAFVDTLRACLDGAQTPPGDLYRSVRVTGTDCTCHEGLVHELSFAVEEGQLSWKDSTKLLEGSTVILAPNLQEELHCAVVVRRCPEELARGRVWVKLLDRKSTVLQGSGPLVMVENFTYENDFVALMEALTAQLDHPMPFEDLILETRAPVHPHSKRSSKFPPFRSHGQDADEHFRTNAVQSSEGDSQWQDALNHALTQELALVHCPAKEDGIAFGVKVLQALLRKDAFEAPVVVLFHSDRTMDEFLKEAMTALPEEKVVRMGGECKDFALKRCSLDEQRRKACEHDDVPLYVVQNRRVLLEKMRKLKAEIDDSVELLKKSMSCLLKSDALKACIAEKNWNQLMSLSTKCSSDPLLSWLSTYTFEDLLSLDMDQNADPKADQATKRPKKTGTAFGQSLADVEMARRTSSSRSPHPPDVGRDFKPKPAAPTTDSCFIEQKELQTEPLFHSGRRYVSLSDIVAAQLRREDVMQASEVVSLQALGMLDRWRLYRFWRQKWHADTKDKLPKLLEKYEKAFLQLQEVMREVDVSILQRAGVVGLTTAAAAEHHRAVKMLAPRTVVVEEAGQIAEPSLIAALTEHCCHLIMIGDHQQLRPALNGFRSSDSARHPQTVSLFQKLIEKGVHPARITQKPLMSSTLLSVLGHLFSELAFDPAAAILQPASGIRGMASDIFFVNSSSLESKAQASPWGLTNEHEARYLALLSKYLISRGHVQARITLLASCAGQVHLLKQLCSKSGLHQVDCAVVDDYQGRSNDIILLSLVRSNELGEVGPLADEGYMSVALTRARWGLYCIGNFKMLVASSNRWKTRMTFLAGQQLYSSTLVLNCPWHPSDTVQVDSCEGLQRAAVDSCKQPCLTVLPCGHQCTRICHDDDRAHDSSPCNLPCGKVLCPSGHKCLKKCFERCPPCQQTIWKARPCGHDSLTTCADDPSKRCCPVQCAKALSCGHPCPKQCGEPCEDQACTATVEYAESPCKHDFFITCPQRQMSGLEKLCPRPCTDVLPCGHDCSGTCGGCRQGRTHIPCQARCEAILLCGHRCQGLCGSNCLPCRDRCGISCDHARCPLSCGAPCGLCLQPCAWQCAHQRCSKMCFERCDRGPCKLPCPRLLPCRHPCTGFCGESCPPLCRVCHRDKLAEGTFGSQQVEASRFVLLEDCNHVVEVTVMDVLMEETTVGARTCPVCGAPVMNSLRYGNAIKASVREVCAVVQHALRNNGLNHLMRSIEALPESAPFAEAVRQLKSEAQESLTGFEAAVLQNKLHFLEHLLRLWQDSLQLTAVKDRVDVQQALMYLKEGHMDLDPTSGQAVIDAFAREVKRALYLGHLFRSFQGLAVPTPGQKIVFGYLRSRLMDAKAFDSALEAVVVSQMKNLYSAISATVRVEDIADLQVTDVPQMTAGHWVKCTQGHFAFSREASSGPKPKCGSCALGAEQLLLH